LDNIMVDTISFRCDACETNLQVAGDTQARSIICTNCGAKVKVPVMFEGPAISYDDAPAAPEVFRAPPVYIDAKPDPNRTKIMIGVGAVAACLVIGLVVFLATRPSAPTGPSPEARELARLREEKAQSEERARAEEQARKVAAAAEAKRKAAAELEQLRLDKERLQQELASKAAAEKALETAAAMEKAVQAAPVAQVSEVVTTAEPAVALPSYDQLQRELKQASAEMLVARSNLAKAQNNLALYKNHISTGQSEISRTEATLRAQEDATRRARRDPPYSETRIAAAVKLEEQMRTKLNRLREEQDKRSASLLEVEAQIPEMEEALRQTLERVNNTKEQLKQVGPPPTGTTPAK
jgi:hypothetical protein